MWKYPIIYNKTSNNNNNSSNSSINTSNNNENIVIINDDIASKEKTMFNKLCPYLFVIDFDKTLVYYDHSKHIDCSKSIYTRPFLYEFLDYIKSINKNNILILWTAGTMRYVYEKLLLLNLSQYFNHILHKQHCDESKQETGVKKSFIYLKKKFPQYQYYRAIFIDDYAVYNSYSSSLNNDNYFKIITVKPFDYTDVYFYYHNRDKNNFGDSTLLNLIIYLKETFFDFNHNDNHHYSTQFYKLFFDAKTDSLSMAKCNANNNDDNYNIIYAIY